MLGSKLLLTNDVVFKAVYGRDDEHCKKALCALLNLILEWDNPIHEIVYLNPFNLAETVNAKVTIMDIKAKTKKGEFFDIEMQVVADTDYVRRSLYYEAKLMGESLESGEDYARINKVVQVSIVRNQVFPDESKFHHVFRYREIETNRELSDVSEIHFIELGKIAAGKAVADMTSLERHCAFMKYANDGRHQDYVRELKLYGDEVIEMTDEILSGVTADERIRQAALARERWEWDRKADESLKRKALEEREVAFKEREVAFKQREAAFKEREVAFKEREVAFKEREVALKELDSAREALNVVNEKAKVAFKEVIPKLRESGMSDQEIAVMINFPVEEVKKL